MRYYTYPFRFQDTARVFSAFHKDSYALFFDSCDSEHPLSHSSYICLDPVERIEHRDDRVVVSNAQGEFESFENPFDVVRQRLSCWDKREQSSPSVSSVHRFRGGAAGFFGYDLGRTLEQLPVRARRIEGQPDMAIGIYQTVLAFHHASGRNILYVLADDQIKARRKADEVFARIDKASKPSPNSSAIKMMPLRSAEQAKRDIQIVIDYIFAGDIFQSNYALNFKGQAPKDFNPYAHYLRLREGNRAPYAGYQNFGNFQIASVSPERFLSAGDGHVQTSPIKGTCSRMEDPEANKSAIENLQNDEKSRAENAMIVDLMRNDLSKVCSDYSIDVPYLFKVESYARVNHMISEICGELRGDQHTTDLLKACFPGGSITGAPKIRAMEIIEELEEERRGAYCGSMGFIDFDGDMESNIMIRTVTHSNHELSMSVGAGIVADSNPDQEYEEILSKAKGMLESFDVSGFEESEHDKQLRWAKSA